MSGNIYNREERWEGGEKERTGTETEDVDCISLGFPFFPFCPLCVYVLW